MSAFLSMLALLGSLSHAQEPAPDAAVPPTRESLMAALQAQGATPEEAAQTADVVLQQIALEQSLQWQQGDVKLAGDKITLHVPASFRYLGAADADKVLVAWGNPPGGGGEGMLVPAGLSPFESGGWAVVLSYGHDGHVSDDDADDIDYDEMLADMQKSTEEANAERTAGGYSAIHLTGWAEPPHYDGGTHKLYWAKVLRSDDGGESLNYDIRVLGREGVLSMSAVAGTEQLAAVKSDMEQVINFAEFNQGSRYLDFDPDVDTVAAYGVGALVAGSLAAKAGLFKGLLALLLAGKKVVLLALAAGATALKRLFDRKGEATAKQD